VANVTGWGRGTWGQGAWNQAIPVTVTGVAATTAVGNVLVIPSIDGVATGVVASGLLNSVTVTGTGLISPTGVVGTSAIGAATSAVVPTTTGVIASGAVGAIIIVYGGSITPTGGSTKYKQRRLINYLMLNSANILMDTDFSTTDTEVDERHFSGFKDIGYDPKLEHWVAVASMVIVFKNTRT